jgi:effector-binding domain-containing protein
MDNLLPIGRFSTLTRLSIKTLRYYDEINLLKPSFIDEETGYRYYSLSQYNHAEQIRLLRSLDVSLADIRNILEEEDKEQVKTLINYHRKKIIDKMNRYDEILNYLDRLSVTDEGDIMSYRIEMKKLKSCPVLTMRFNTTEKDFSNNIEKTYGNIYGFLKQSGLYVKIKNAISIYHIDDFDENNIDVEVGFEIEQQIDTPPTIICRTIHGGTFASTIHNGSYQSIGMAYKELIQWIQNHGHQITGRPREIYLVGPSKDNTPKDYVTEILYPIDC